MSEERKIRILVVDDSALMRKKISDIINSDDALEVIGTASNGKEALDEVLSRKPDVVTLDISMPKMDGLTALGYIMSECPTPVVIVSAYVGSNSPETIMALEYGAVDIVAKPGAVVSLQMNKVAAEMIEKIKIAAGVNKKKLKLNFKSKAPKQCELRSLEAKHLVVIGASTGGPKALVEVMSYFPADLDAAFLIVQHMPKEFTASFAERLNCVSHLEVVEARDGDVIKTGRGLVAPGDFHLTVAMEKDDPVVSLNKEAKVCHIRPSIDVTMRSAAKLFKNKIIGVLLTGMGTDGVDGLAAIKQSGGKTIVEDESTAIVNGMPGTAVAKGVADIVVPLPQVAKEVVKLING